LIDRSGRLVVNLIGADPGPMFKHFGKGFEPGQPAFDGVPHRTTQYGIVLEDAVGFLAGKVIAKHDAGDHWIYQAHVIDADGNVEAAPYVHIRKNGLSY
jgi:flavin reductase (DIM6/NTAB) family NADH-FMN oxidoreductase RutF